MRKVVAPNTTTEQIQEIGDLFRRARSSHADSLCYIIACGRKLCAIKDTLDHGEWLPWVKDHQADLGFNDQTASRLMRAYKSNMSLATDLPPEECLKINRQIWGHDPEPKMVEDLRAPVTKYLGRLREWFGTHPVADNGIPQAEVADVLAAVTDSITWLTQLQAALTRNGHGERRLQARTHLS